MIIHGNNRSCSDGQRFTINDNTNELVPSIPAISLPTATIPQIPNNIEMNPDSHTHDIEMNPDSLPTTTPNNNDSNIDVKLFDCNTRYKSAIQIDWNQHNLMHLIHMILKVMLFHHIFKHLLDYLIYSNGNGSANNGICFTKDLTAKQEILYTLSILILSLIYKLKSFKIFNRAPNVIRSFYGTFFIACRKVESCYTLLTFLIFAVCSILILCSTKRLKYIQNSPYKKEYLLVLEMI